MKKLLILVIAGLMVSAITGCQSGGAGTPTPSLEYEIEPAPIEELRISFAESQPVQVMLYIKGGLPDSATTFDGLKVGELRDDTITVTVTTKRPIGVVAAEVYSYFEKNVNLGSNFKSGQTYEVNVNDASIDFKMP